MSNQMVVCSHCGGSGHVTVVKEKKLGGKWRKFESSAGTLPFKGSGMAGKIRPVSGNLGRMTGRPLPMAMGNLSPGESRSSKVYRERSMGDVWPPLVWSVVSGALVGVVALPIALGFDLPLWTPLAAMVGTTTLAWFVVSRDFHRDDALIVSEQIVERKPDPAPVSFGPPAVNLEFNERNQRGAIVHQQRATLRAPGSNHAGLYQYCRALAQTEAFPSLEGGDGGPGAQSFGYTGREFAVWRSEATRAKLLEKRKGRNQGYEITDRGLAAFARVGRQKLEVASYGI